MISIYLRRRLCVGVDVVLRLHMQLGKWIVPTLLKVFLMAEGWAEWLRYTRPCGLIKDLSEKEPHWRYIGDKK